MKWTLESALALVRHLQTRVAKPCGYHACLGGSVLNNGESDKDVDLYFLPLVGQPADSAKLIRYLETRLGPSEPIGDAYPGELFYEHRLKFEQAPTGRVDVFIVGTTTELTRAVFFTAEQALKSVA